MITRSATCTLRNAALAALAATTLLAATAIAPAHASAATPFETQGMWIWYVSGAEKGNIAKIAARAKRFHVDTVYVKSADGSTYWKQFDQNVAALKAAGLKVCSWQYVYGKNPITEANLAARSVTAGADCIVIDAEVEYQNRYAQAAQYIKQLRSKVGPDYPVGFTSFAYPDFHPTVPYSVFLGPGGAQWNLPQMYFKAFNVKIPQVFQHTYTLNQIYQRRIAPLGQTYEGVSYAQALLFRKYAQLYRAPGLSWWVWSETQSKTWKALRRSLRKPGAMPATPYPLLKQGYKNDMVRWCKLKLNASGATLALNLSYDAPMTAAVKAFQAVSGLLQTGQVDAATWPRLQAVQLPNPQ